MKKEFIELLDFEDEKPKVGRPKKADSKTKKKSLIIAGISFFTVILLLIFGYGTLIGFDKLNLLANVNKKNTITKKKILINEIKPLIKNITIKNQTSRKIYLTVSPSNATNKNISYKSSNEDIVIVDKKGKITGISEGKATITATTKDGSNKSVSFNIKVIENASGKCTFTSLSKIGNGINYELACNNAKIKEIQYKTDNEYKILLTKKFNDIVEFSKEDLKKKITFKVVYYPNNSKITKYSTKTINNSTTTTTKKDGKCQLTIKSVNSNSCKYDITCSNASVSKIAYKIGNSSYIGINTSNLADTIIFEESDVTRVIYFNVEYSVDGSSKIKTLTESSIIEKGNVTTTMVNE